ncbi:MAG: MSMEG_0570 family nitrogen starvation response protein [Elainellaceae cyanobacterium]
MPEMQFTIRWPDGAQEVCYSPSLVIEEYLTPGEDYALEDFVARSRTALTIASDRVQKKYGFPCSRALGQLQRIEAKADGYSALEQPTVAVVEFTT